MIFLFLLLCLGGAELLGPVRESLLRSAHKHRHGHARKEPCSSPVFHAPSPLPPSPVTACLFATAAAFEETVHPAAFRVVLAESRNESTTVHLTYLSASSTAVIGRDIRSFNTTVVIPAGETLAIVKVRPYDDGNDNDAAAQTITLRIADSTNGTLLCPRTATSLLFKRGFFLRLLSSLFSPLLGGPNFDAAGSPLQVAPTAPVPVNGESNPTVVDFFDVCQADQDCVIAEAMTYVTLTLPVSPENAAKSFGFIHIHLGATLEVLVAPGGARSDYELRCKSMLVVDGGRFRVGYSGAPFGIDGSTFTLKLYGAETDPAINCLDPTCGVPLETWSTGGAQLYSNPSIPNGTDYFYSYKPMVFEPTSSQNFFGKKVLAVGWGGRLHLHGALGAVSNSSIDFVEGSKASWSRVKNPVSNGTNVEFQVENEADFVQSWFPTGTKFRAALTSTDWFVTHNEVINVTRIPGGFRADSIQFPHMGPKITLAAGVNANITKRSGDFRAAFAVIDRSVKIISAGNGPFDAPNAWGGHTLFRQGARFVRISGVLFEKLGQGGLKGRYPFHAHLMRKTNSSNSMFLRDSTVFDSNTRMVTVHGTHSTVIERVAGVECFGHAFYLEDGSEILNRFAWNLAAFAKSGFTNDATSGYKHNPRNVSGIFSHPGQSVFSYPFGSAYNTVLGDAVARGWLSDYLTPTLFWIRNAYNVFIGNHASGTEHSGVCYWFIASPLNHPSASMRWNNTHINAFLQQPHDWQATVYGGTSQQYLMASTPTLLFDGNSGSGCSAMIMTIPDYASNSLRNGYALQAPNNDPNNSVVGYAKSNFNTKYNYAMNNEFCSNQYGCDFEFPQPSPPNVTLDTNGATCTAGATSTSNCGTCAVSRNAGELCRSGVVAISNFTGSFGATDVNFATIWLRTQFFVLTDSWLADIVGGGVNFANSGDPTGVSVGFWGLVFRSVFIGSTQTGQIFADFRGPVTPEAALATGLRCVRQQWPGGQVQVGADLCILPASGQVFSYNAAGISQHFLHIYDGPVSVVDSHFANISANAVQCPRNDNPNIGTDRPWCQNGISKRNGVCLNPNAALGWKQPNGFDYPPGYLMKSLSFENVDIHHHVYLPYFQSTTFLNDIPAALEAYCPAVFPTPGAVNRTVPCGPCTPEQCVNGTGCGIGVVFCVAGGCNANGFNDISCPGACCDTSTCVNPSNYNTRFLDFQSNWNTIDRQTNLKEMDGSISFRKTSTGFPSYIINRDVFFYGPNAEVECGSLGTSYVIPHHFGRYYALNRNWNSPESCRTFDSMHQCKVLMTHRLSYEISDAELPIPPVIAAGPKGGMGSLFMEGTTYLLELLLFPESGTPTVASGDLNPVGAIYNMQFLYPTSYGLPNKFLVYVGSTFQIGTDFSFCIFNKIGSQVSREILCIPQNQWGSNIRSSWLSSFLIPTLNTTTGFLSIVVDHRAIPPEMWAAGEAERCVPTPFCAWNSTSKKCGCGEVEDPALLSTCQDICSNVGGIANAECPGGDPAGCLGFSFHVPNTPYMPPFGTNATDWLKTNRFLFEPWSAQIKSQTFIGPPIGDKPCPTSF